MGWILGWGTLLQVLQLDGRQLDLHTGQTGAVHTANGGGVAGGAAAVACLQMGSTL